jgi:hypothetical protein
MGKYSEYLCHEVEAHEAEVRAKIGNLLPEELVGWCRDEIKRSLDGFNWKIDLVSMMSHCNVSEDQEMILDLAQTSNRYFNSLVEFAKQRRKEGLEIPEPWRDYLFDVLIGARSKPSGRGRASEAQRDVAICRCIRYIANCTQYKVSRNAASSSACGISIVAKAMGVSYYTIATVWKRQGNRV